MPKTAIDHGGLGLRLLISPPGANPRMEACALKMRKSQIFLATALLLWLTGCGGQVDPPPVAITCPPYCIPTPPISTSQTLGSIGQTGTATAAKPKPTRTVTVNQTFYHLGQKATGVVTVKPSGRSASVRQTLPSLSQKASGTHSPSGREFGPDFGPDFQ